MSALTLSGLETRLDELFKKAPSLPANSKPILVHYAPYAALICGVIAFITSGILKFFSYSAVIPGSFSNIVRYNHYLLAIFNIIVGLILIFSFTHLKQRSIKGWRMLFALMILELLIGVFSFDVVSLLSPLVGFYLLFQLKSYYS